MSMNAELSRAIQLRAEGRHQESRDLLLALHAAAPDDPLINYHCAWAHDLLGYELAALPYYEWAIALGLAGDDLRGALLGLGSTYRCLGFYQEAAQTLKRGAARFPDDRAFEVFLAMSLYNLGQSAAALELLLRHLAETTQDESLLRYRRAILFYADKLDQCWA
jgi:tetratricopeptide (TPR) repeat protein